MKSSTVECRACIMLMQASTLENMQLEDLKKNYFERERKKE
jgi:hypothetical protein